MASLIEKFQNTLYKMFMLDQADLDFGIYRIMNQKKDEITNFLNITLPQQVRTLLSENASAHTQDLQKQLDDTIKQVLALGYEPDTNPKVKELRDEIAKAGSSEEMENTVYSHLTTFFSRYYEGGDFISQRRYKKDVYAIPYEGEEVKLHWANADQYYIKTGEYFRNYSFTIADDKRVEFTLKDVTTEQNNNLAQNNMERRFALYEEEPVTVDGDTLHINFTYELYPKTTKQETLIEKAFQTVRGLITAEFKGVFDLAPTEKDKNRNVLQKHLKNYVARNTFDYFIHKDLHGFLTRELDFYIKNEILMIDDINSRSTEEFVAHLTVIKTIKAVGASLIQFLAQLEEFQKRLWLKKKFVVQADYCIALDRVPEELYPEICANDRQREEWVRLFAIDEIKGEGMFKTGYSEPLTEKFLQENPFLVLDTAFFSDKFKKKLISSIENLDEQCDGLMINSENFQALQLLQEKYRECVELVHIDPPYNTETSGFLYKNSYKHSSWGTMMRDRILSSRALLSETYYYQCHIDENEYEYLFYIFNCLAYDNAGTIVWDKLNPMLGKKGVASQHEYIIHRTSNTDALVVSNENIIKMKEYASISILENGGVNDASRKQYASLVNKDQSLTGGEKAYRYLDENGSIYRLVAMGAPEKRTDPKYFIPLIHPVTGKPCPVPPNGFSRSPETMKELLQNRLIVFGKDETTQPQKIVYLPGNAKKQISSVISEGKSGKAYLDKLGMNFPYAHPLSLYETLFSYNNINYILDYFAGSGTTGHAVINLNRADNGKRKYILVEMGTYFDTVTKPRIQKVIYSEDWNNGKPVSRKGSSHCFKYMRLEQYEDTLNNLVVKNNTLDSAGEFYGSFLLGYMLDMETKDSLFNLKWFENPFNMKLLITRNNETIEEKVDLVETFNYLIGLYVDQIAYPKDGICTVMGRTRKGRKTLVIWRDCTKVSNDALNDFFRRSEYSVRDNEFDYIYVNGDNNLENMHTEEDTWKVVLIEQEFNKQMFNI